MNILVTGSGGFVGRNLVENLKNIRDGRDRTRPELYISAVYEFDKDTDRAMLDEYCKSCHFVFHLAGVNRPKHKGEFWEGNPGFLSVLLDTLKKYGNTCPVMLASSSQASLAGRFADSEYGRSKLAGEELLLRYEKEVGAKVLVYRFPNLFGKWCRPNYNSAVATFCHAVANDLEYVVNSRDTELELLYIDDVISEMLDALEGNEHRCEYDGPNMAVKPDGAYCYVPVSYHVTLGEIVDLLQDFKAVPGTLTIPDLPEQSFVKKLYSTYLSYLPPGKISYRLPSRTDERGSFTEWIRTVSCGQVSVSVTKPGMTRGQHWHNSKWESFVVVSGHGLIQERRIGMDAKTGEEYPVLEFEVSGKDMRVVQMLPGYTHNITNLSQTEDLISVIWANEQFDREHPDTFSEKVK